MKIKYCLMIGVLNLMTFFTYCNQPNQNQRITIKYFGDDEIEVQVVYTLDRNIPYLPNYSFKINPTASGVVYQKGPIDEQSKKQPYMISLDIPKRNWLETRAKGFGTTGPNKEYVEMAGFARQIIIQTPSKPLSTRTYSITPQTTEIQYNL